MAIYAGRPGSATAVMYRPANTATEKQVDLIMRLSAETRTSRNLADVQALSKSDASTLIGILIDAAKVCRAMQRDPKVAPRIQEAAKLADKMMQEVGPGFYRLGDDFYKVNISKTSGRPYAMLWDGARWDFEEGKGVYRKLTADMALTAEDAKAFGDEYHACVFCTQQLTDQRSIDAGYGPKCAVKHGLPWG